MTRRYVSVADTAKEVRKALKEAFPRQKFSVRSHSYSGGASIQVRWIDGPAESDVKQVAKEFAGATFDGMVDMKSYHTSEFNGEQVHWGADFVHCNRDLSDDERERVRPLVVEAIERAYGITDLAPSRYYQGICVEGIDRVLAGGIDQMIHMASEYQALKPEESE